MLKEMEMVIHQHIPKAQNWMERDLTHGLEDFHELEVGRKVAIPQFEGLQINCLRVMGILTTTKEGRAEMNER
jgi:hypothetical protein